MQEFTIQSDDPQSVPNQLQSTSPSGLNQQNTQYNSNPLENSTYTTDDKSKFLVIVLVSTLTVLLFTVVFVSYLHFSNESAQIAETANDNILGAETEETTDDNIANVPDKFEDLFYYTDDSNIYEYNLKNKESTQLTNFPKSITSEIIHMQLIDEKYLGFVNCDIAITRNACKLFIHNLQTDKSEVIDEIKSNIDNISWIDNKKYIFSQYNPVNQNIEVNLIDENESKKLATIPGSISDRDKFIEDSKAMSLSPNKEKVLYINTFSNNGFNFKIYIISLEGKITDQIEDATQPRWIDNKNIIFRKYSNKRAGHLYIYNLGNKKMQKLGSNIEASYNVSVINPYISFWEPSEFSNLYIYNKQDDKLLMKEEKAAYPAWISNDKIIYGKVRKCEENECRKIGTIQYESQLIVEKYIVKNIHSGYTEEINVRNKYLENGILTWVNSL